MRETSAIPWKALESRTPAAFLFAGAMAFSYAVLKGLKAYAGLEVITFYDVLWGGFVLLVPTLALLGLFPRLREAAPRLSVAALVPTAIAGVAIVALQIQLVVTALSVEGHPEIPGDTPVWTAVALLLVFVTLAFGFLLWALAARRADTVSRTVARLLVVPFLGWAGLIVANVVLPPGDYLGLFAYAPIGAALLAVGYLFRTAGAPTNRGESVPDSTP